MKKVVIHLGSFAALCLGCHAELVSASPKKEKKFNESQFYQNRVYLMPSILYSYHVYILSNKNKTTFYIGVTNDIKRRVLEHKSGYGSKFSHKYNLFDLLFMEKYSDIREAIQREKQLKNWHRDWKVNLIRSINPDMTDIAIDWFDKEEIEQYKNERLLDAQLKRKEVVQTKILINCCVMPKQSR